MTYSVRFSRSIDWKIFSRLPLDDKKRIQRAIQQKLKTHPELFGKPLRRSLTGCRSLRVGAYRIIYRISKAIVEVILIGHRSTIYDETDGLL